MKDYHKDLKVSDFSSWDDYLEERVKRGLDAGYTFSECYQHWLDEFLTTLCTVSEQQHGSTSSNNQTQ